MREFSIFHLAKLEWDASKIGIKSNGGWAVFTDPITHKSLNSPRRPYPEPKIAYRRKTEEQLEQEEKARQWREIRTKKKGNNFNNFSTVTNPLLNPPKDNYKEFKARKQLISSKNSNGEFDDTIPFANSAFTSRSMPRKPHKIVQLGRDLQVTSLNTQRNHCYSRTSVAKCTPRSIAESIQYYKSDEYINDEEETNYEEDIKICDYKIISENEEENIIQNDDEINKVETEILNISMNSASSINSNESNNKTQNKNDHKNTHENFDKNEIDDNNADIEIEIKNEEDYNESEYNEKDSLNDDVEQIKIKVDLSSDQTNDSNSMNDETSSKNELINQNENEHEQETQNDINESKEKNDDKNETKTELNISNSTTKQWKRKRTGEVISRKRIVITSKNSSENERKDSSFAEETQDSNENKFNHTHPNDKPINYNFKYNHPNNFRKSEVQHDYYKKQKKEIKINKKSAKITSTNLDSINNNNKHNNNEIDYEKNKIKSESDKKENNSEINNNKQIKNINNENIENENHFYINKNSDNQNHTSKNINSNNDIWINEENNDQGQFNEIENIDNTSINDNQNDSTQISNDDQKNFLQNDPTTTTNNNEEEEQKDSNEITVIDNDNDKTNSIEISLKSDNINENNKETEHTNSKRENKDIINNESNENIEFENAESFNGYFLTNCDSNDDYIESYATSIASKNTKKASNVYGHNYNDYNYYNNVLTANTKANVASGAPFQFLSTRTGSISDCEISHNLSPLPSTRRPATAIRQRFIERPECIGPERFFKGDDPAPARRFFQSANLVAEMRREEEMKLIKNAQVKRNLSKTVNKKSLSLYERSLKPREKRYCWPRDFAQFSAE